METVRVEGVTYTKVATIAKKFRYTTDYVGQLCRSGKVDCQFVGRAWYVSEESLLRHKDNRYIESRPTEKTIKNNVVQTTEEERVSVSPRLKKVTAKQVLESKSHFLTRLEVTPSRYYADETELLPQPLKAASPAERIVPTIPATVEIEPAEAVSVRVTATTSPKKLAFTDVPAVALRGQLAIKEVELAQESDVISPDQLRSLESVSAANAEVDEIPPVAPLKINPKRAISPVSTPRHAAPRSFTPQTVAVAEPSSRLGYLLTAAIVTSVVFAGFFVTASQVFVIEGSNVSASVGFSLEALLQLL